MLAPLCVALAIVTAAAPQKAHRPAPPVTQTTLATARAALREVKRDPAKRRYRDQWERAIAGLEAAARGKDRAPALLEAARARYALYRFSQVESDRAAALRLAAQARRAGSREAAGLAAAIRKEAGEEKQPTRKVASGSRQASARPTAPSAIAAATAAVAAPPKPAPRPTASKARPTPTPTATPTPAPIDSDPDTHPELDSVAAEDAADEPPSADPVLARILARLEAEAAVPVHRAPPDAPAASRAAPSRPGPIRRVVIDAGHGGHDTGAIGPTGVREKDVTLAIARRVARKLSDAGLEAILTRADDRYLALDERTEIANSRGGDLFVSIHANAHPRRDRRGVETYVLNVTNDRYAKRLAARENGALDDADDQTPEVRRILSDLDAKASAAPSRRLAEGVQRELTAAIRARHGDVRDLGVKSALFYVLLGARMPAVLVETSFLSNRVEERRLASPAFQEDVAAGIARAIGAFAAREARIAAR